MGGGGQIIVGYPQKWGYVGLQLVNYNRLHQLAALVSRRRVEK